MVENKKIRRCEKCTNAVKLNTYGYVYCKLHHSKVWGCSVACCFYDDTEIF